jgi:hypothetical protein
MRKYNTKAYNTMIFKLKRCYYSLSTGSYLASVPYSTWKPQRVVCGWPKPSLLSSVKRGKISSNSATVEANKFVRPHQSRTHKYIINACCNGAQSTRSLIDTGGGYQLWSSKYENRSLSLLPIRYSPLSPSCSARSRIEPTSDPLLT